MTDVPARAAEREEVVEVLHGERIADPYRWLEHGDDPRVTGWTDAQNARTRAALDAVPQRADLERRLRAFLAVGVLGVPRPAAGRFFLLRRAGPQRQIVLYVRDGIDGAERALVDPNALDEEGLVSLDWYHPSPDGAYVAYGLSRGGTELSTLYVVDVATGKDLGESIPHTRFASVAWVGEAFYYTRHPAPGAVPPGDEHYYRRVYFHRLGDDPEHDALVFGEGRPKEEIATVACSPDGRWALFSSQQLAVRNDLYLLDRERGERTTISEGVDGLTNGIPADDGLYLATNVGSPHWRIDFMPYRDVGAAHAVVPEGEHPIEWFDLTRGSLVVSTLERATSRLAVWSRDGRQEREVKLPELGSLLNVQGDQRTDSFGYTFQSFTRPSVAFVGDARDGTVREFARLASPGGFDPDAIVTEQVRYRSRDGTFVTMFLVHRRDVRPSGGVATILNGYGGFNVARTPLYAANVAAWADAGGMYAVANLRGGSEYGERWHRAGMREHKQNVFDDFHAAAEWLVASGWTTPEHLGISGGSNGGLLVGAALTQRPELFGAVHCAVPLLDMLRYQNFRIARFWVAEYGSAEDPTEFRWLYAYSPYHRIRRGTRYPPVLLTTAEGDSRVDPMHARKMAARLQSEAHPESVVLLRVDRDAGHGVGKPFEKQVDDAADQLAFLAAHLGLGEIGS